jgi:hypothetical protein
MKKSLIKFSKVFVIMLAISIISRVVFFSLNFYDFWTSIASSLAFSIIWVVLDHFKVVRTRI